MEEGAGVHPFSWRSLHFYPMSYQPGPYGQGAYRNACVFCHGKGCFDCDVKGERAMNESFSNPLVFKADSPEDMERMKSLLHIDKLSTPEGIEAIHRAFDEQRKERQNS